MPRKRAGDGIYDCDWHFYDDALEEVLGRFQTARPHYSPYRRQVQDRIDAWGAKRRADLSEISLPDMSSALECPQRGWGHWYFGRPKK